MPIIHSYYVAEGKRQYKKDSNFFTYSNRKGHSMKKMMMWGLVAVVAILGFVSSPAQAKEPGVKPLEGKTALEGPRGHYRRSPRHGGYYRPRRSHWGGSFYYGGGYGGGYYRPRYYAPAPVVIAPPPTVYYGGTVSCY